jgi:hypothetical protein
VRSSRTRCTVALRARVLRTLLTARMSALPAQVEHSLHTVHCTHCTLYTVLTAHCTVLTIHCTVLTAQAPRGIAVDLRVSPRAPTLALCARGSVFRSVSALILLRTGTSQEPQGPQEEARLDRTALCMAAVATGLVVGSIVRW